MKKTGKRLSALLLALVMVLSLVPMTALAARVNDDEIAIEAPGTEETAHLAATPAVLAGGEALTDASDNTRDVGYTDDAYANDNNSVIVATASSQEGKKADGSDSNSYGDGPSKNAVDGNTGTVWHTRYNTGDGDGSADALSGLLQAEVAASPENRWIQLEIVAGAQWLSGLRYYPKNGGGGNGDVTACEVRVSINGTDWSTVTTGSSWDLTNSGWKYKAFDAPVQAKYVRLYGIQASSNYMNAAEVRLVKALESNPIMASTTITVKPTGTDDVIQGATVVVGGQTLTTDGNGQVTVSLIQTQEYTATVTAANYASTTTPVTGGTPTDVALTPILRTISGTVTATGTDASPEGAVVTLVIADSHYTNVVGGPRAEVMADGTYSLNINALAAGSYKVRVSKAGYGAVIGETAVTVEATETTETHSNVNATLAKIDGTPDYSWTFDSAQDQPGDDDLNKGSGVASLTYEDGGMKIKWTNGDRGNNLVSIRNTNLKNGVVEFDATRGNEDLGFKDNYAVNANRFGLAMRSYSADENTSYWLYIGQDSVTYQWGVEWFKVTNSGTNGQWWDYTNNNPVSFGPNETRHFKVTVSDDTNVKLEIDGMEILSTTLATSGNNDPVDKIISSGDVGIIWGNSDLSGYGPHTVLIDNLCVFSNDPKATVSWDNSQKIKGTYTFNGENELTSGAEVPAGSKVSIQAGDDAEAGKTLGGLTVVKTDDNATTVPATQTGDGVWSFTMPDYAVTVTGALKNAFAADLPQDGDANVVPKEGKAYTLNVTENATADYQWYRVTAGSSDVAVGTNSATYTPVAADVGKTLKVVVTGTDTYAGIKTLTTGTVAAADVVITGFGPHRSAITMWTNDKENVDTGEEVGGTTTLILSLNPALQDGQSYEPYTIAWSSSAEGVATVAAVQNDPLQATLTAVANGTATITATLTRTDVAEGTDGRTITATCTVTVKTKTNSVTITNNADTSDPKTPLTQATPLVLYTNNEAGGTDPEHAGHFNTATLTATPDPATATDTAGYVWHRTDGAEGLIRLDASGSDSKVRTISVTNISEQNVGEKTIQIKSGEGNDATVYGTFRVVVLRHLVHDVTVGYTGGATEARPGVTVEAITSALNIGDAGVAGLTYEWYRKAADSSTAVKIADQSGKTYTLTEADIGCEITVKVIAAPKYGTEVEAAQRYYYQGTRTSTNAITVLKNAAPTAPELTSTPYSNNAGTVTKGTIVIDSPVAGETYEYRQKTSAAGEAEAWSNWADAELTGDDNNTIADLEAGDYQVRIKENNLHDAGTAKAVTVQDGSKTYHTVSRTITPTEGGTAVLSSTSVEDGQSVTLTVTPASGYQIKSVMIGEAAQTGTPGAEGATVYTATVTANTEFAVTFEKIKVTISHTFTNLKCSLAQQAVNSHEVEYGSVTEITLSLAEGVDPNAYKLPERGNITIVIPGKDGAADTPFANFNYDQASGKISITGGVTQDLKITASAAPRTYNIGFETMSHVSGPEGAQSATYGTDKSIQLTAETGYDLPTTVTVKRGETTLTQGTDYTYASGLVTIKGAAITGNITISATGVKILTPITSATISNVAKVGNQLSFTVAPAGATATYQWQVSDAANGAFTAITGATGQTYTLTAAEAGKYVRVVLTATGDYSTPENGLASNAVGPVAKKDPTGITLDKPTHSMSVGQTVELTATVTPNDAGTDQTITWRVLAEDQDTEVTNATITPVAGSDNKVIVTAVSRGTVRINARTANGLTSNCTLIIERPNVYAVTYMTHGENAQVSISTDEGAVTNENNTVEAGKTVTVAVTPANEAHFVTVSATANNTAVALTKGTGNTWTFTMPGYPVSIDINVTSEQPQTPHTVTFTLNGAALAEVTGGTASGSVVTVAHNGTLTFKLTVANTAKEVKSVKVDGAAITPVKGVYTISAITADKAVVVEVGDKGVTPPTVDTAALETAITAATQAKAGVRTYETEMDPAEVSRGTKYTTGAAMDTLNTAITAAQAALTAETQAEVDQAVETLNAAVTAFNATVKTGTKATSSSTSSRPSTSTETTTNPDGSKTTTVTDNRTGTVTETTEKADGTTEVVETKKDGTVTETKTDAEGAKTEKVTSPDQAVTITVTDAQGEELAKVELPAEIPAPEARFDDVPEGHWADKAIQNAAALELIEGVGDNKFGIHSTMTRGALATVLHRLSQGKTDYETAFRDVAAGQYYTEGVAWAAKAGVVKGFNPDIFAPDQIITREQLAVMLARYAKLLGMDTQADAKALDQFADGEATGAWAVDGLAWCVENGILQGKGGSALDPTANVSRAEAAVMLDRFIDLLK